jgi:membrane-associated protease RseP (regulator of RpoE activity)
MELWLFLLLTFISIFLYSLIFRSIASISRNKAAASTESKKKGIDLEKQSGVENTTKLRPITQNEESELRHCFPWGVYYLQNIDYLPQAILCRGKLRTNPETAYQTIQENIKEKFSNRFLVVFQEGLKDKPFFALVPNPEAKQTKDTSEKLVRPLLALGLLIITLFTTTVVGSEIAGVSLEAVQENPSLLLQGLPYSIALITILGIHETGHYFITQRYGIKATLPYFIPVPFFLGTFGAYIQMRSPVPNRKALFDISVAGPLAGLIASLPALIWGLSQSEIIPLSDESSILNFDSLNPRFSLLLSILAKLAIGNDLSPGMVIDLHPVAVAGFIGVVVTALNLMPVGQLDGGHIVHAMFGQKTGAVIGQVSRLLVFILAIAEPGFLLWAIILLFMPVVDEPALNDVSDLDNKRDLIGMVCLVLLVLILLPIPATFVQWLNL